MAHNKLTMNTGFDFELLNLELNSIKDIDTSSFDFNLNFDFEKENPKNTVEELNIEDFGDEKFEHICPRCKFKWYDVS